MAILLTWLVWLAAAAGVGLLAISRWKTVLTERQQLQLGLWIGIAILLLAPLVAHFFVPMGALGSRALSWLFVVIGGASLLRFAWIRRRPLVAACRRAISPSRWAIAVFSTLVLVAIVIISNFAAAEPMDADAGLYRLSVINYSRDNAIIPGLANLHDRYGFNSALWPLTPFLEVGLWNDQGFRLVAGLFLAGLAVDLFLRILVPRVGGTLPGDWVVVIGSAFIMAVVFTDSGRWIPSPGQDIAAFVPSLAAVAYLSDALWSKGTTRTVSLNVAMIAAGVSGAIRPLGWVLFAAILVLSVFLAWPRKNASSSYGLRRFCINMLGAFIVLALAVAMLLRDVILSGWLLFPTSPFGIPVPWQLPDPSSASDGITSWARAPGISGDAVLEGFGWFGDWFASFRGSREAYLLLLIALGSVLTVPFWRRAAISHPRIWAKMSVSLLPVFLLLILWFFNAPDVRFAWAPLIAVVAVPIGWLLSSGVLPSAPVRVGGLAILIVMLGTQVANDRILPRGNERVMYELQLGPFAWDVAIAKVRDTEAVTVSLPDGTHVQIPKNGNECWNIQPLCVHPGSVSETVRYSGPWRSGFAPR